jgi:hypothetical protein
MTDIVLHPFLRQIQGKLYMGRFRAEQWQTCTPA